MSENEEKEPGRPATPGPINEAVQHSSVSARIPANVARGTLSTGAIVFDSLHEFVIDFLLRLGSPHSVAARIVLPPPVFLQLIAALRENLKKYKDQFGPPPALPVPPPQPPAGDGRGKIADMYDQLKLPDEMLSGVYSNAVMIGHSPSEFWFDFITTFFPRSAVSSRVFLAAQHVPSLLDTLNIAYQSHQRKQAEAQRPPQGAPPAPPGEPQQ
ncbi:MAG TPA: DUF3467 domain-containing protein, partial [Pirellulales bacterium]|jgi:hypothetical protein|nr:DUF3467 domain-containing protein [Pirellulales bacterium]